MTRFHALQHPDCALNERTEPEFYIAFVIPARAAHHQDTISLRQHVFRVDSPRSEEMEKGRFDS